MTCFVEMSEGAVFFRPPQRKGESQTVGDCHILALV